ncbi:SMI1/KNR4 family protein [Shimazuella kribbensis]|uniref:SMI1/KNR4 family protein n=1 Tax=Shimazuella kribbensis TaxID=139808 RepID=UPI000420C11B|nr:SMI1/KNR4 family protein [Shimazuella kribbensis]
MSSLEWDFATNVSLDDIKKAEQKLGILFPREYVECVIHNHGGIPKKEYYTKPNGRKGVFGQLLLMYKSDNYLDVVSTYKFLLEDELIPPYIIPFANDPAGNFLCFDYSTNLIDPSIILLDHELDYQEDDDAITSISNSFKDLLDSLYFD